MRKYKKNMDEDMSKGKKNQKWNINLNNWLMIMIARVLKSS